MVDASIGLALERRLDDVHARVLSLTQRMDALERRTQATASRSPARRDAVPVEAQPVTVSTPPAHAPEAAPHPAVAAASTTIKAPIVRPPRHDAGGTPILPMAVAGGGALLLGLGFFAWHAMEQAWLDAGARLVLGGLAAVALTLGAWPLARRGHAAVAGAVGGAGLGAWFSAWLVARFAHDLVNAPQAFAALALGALATLALAGRLRLRLMAGLAAVAACATPAITTPGGDRLSELMLYQLGLLLVFGWLDRRNTWPELPTLGLLGTWALGLGWAAGHLGPHNGPIFMMWTAVLVVATACSAWRLVLTTADLQSEQLHVGGRVVVTGLVSWAATAWTFQHDPGAFATATALLALWHGGLAWLSTRHRAPHVARIAVGLAWVQAAVVPPLLFSGASVATGWVLMALVAVAITRTRAAVTGARLMVLPTVCTVAWSVAHHGESWALPAGLVAAAIPFVAGFVPRKDEPNLTLAGMGTVAWVATALATVGGPIPLQLAIAVVPAVVAAAYALVRPRPDETRFAVVHLLVGLVASVGALVETKAFSAASPPMDLLALVAGLGACTMFVLARVLSRPSVDAQLDTIDLGGFVAAGFVGLALAVLAPGIVPDYVAAGRTAAIALTGLLLVVAGLRLDRVVFRQLGLGAIAIAAGKVVVIDTAGATLAARALSFIGIGAVLILGAFAYSRAQRRKAGGDEAPAAAQSLGCTW